MYYHIATMLLHVTGEEKCLNSLGTLAPYQCEVDSTHTALHVDMLCYKFPDRQIPPHDSDYSGFLTRESSDPDKESFIFCIREGQLLFGLQKEKDGHYNAYIHSQTTISCKTVLQYVLLLEGCWKSFLGVHAVTLEDQGRAIMFSAPSGTGKTTHTELWRKEFGTRILNGDFAILHCTEEGPVFHGTPFCGSSPYAEQGLWPVTDIVFLRQSPRNRIQPIGRITAAANALENCFVPSWDTARTKQCMDLIGMFLKHTRIWLLECNMDPEVAHVVRETLLRASRPQP